MKSIFRPEPQSGYGSILLSNSDDWSRMAALNFERQGATWKSLNFEFYNDEKRKKSEPDIAVVVPGVAVRKELAEKIFFDVLDDIEILPISVSGQAWVLANCLVSTRGMDLKKSFYHRDPSGRIFLIQKMFVNDPELSSKLAFTIDGSNRSTVFVLERFVQRVHELGLQGIKFKAVGEVC